MTETAENDSKNGDMAVPDKTDEKLIRRIVRQVEFYFGDYNLMRDNFMRDEMKKDEGWFTMETMLKFKRLSSICSEPLTIIEALKTSKIGLLEIDAENHRIRRKPNREIPEDNEEYRRKVKARTVHINGFQSEENIDDVNDFLATYGRIEGVQLQRTSDKKFKGSLFATFFKQEDADSFIQAPMVYYKVCELTKMSKSDYYHQLNDSRQSEKKKRKISDESQSKHDDLKGTVALKVSGITDDTIIHTDVKQVFESSDVHTIRFFDRLSKMGSEGYLIFQDERKPEELLEILKQNKGDTKVTLKISRGRVLCTNTGRKPEYWRAIC
uniref:lupus La protein homolog n=1 Tax=Styela clava TaxID=7725 RepID=UPI00193A659B|nr:lupus La protein homolog [Styela clava]